MKGKGILEKEQTKQFESRRERKVLSTVLLPHLTGDT